MAGGVVFLWDAAAGEYYARTHTNAHAQWTVVGVRVRARAISVDEGGWRWRTTTTTAFHYRNPPAPPDRSGAPAPTPTDCGPRHPYYEPARRSAPYSRWIHTPWPKYRVCAPPPRHTGALVSAVHSHSRDALTRRRRPWTYRWDGERVVCFDRVGGRVDAADDFPDDEARARAPDFSLSDRRRSVGAGDRWLRSGVRYALELPHVSAILFYARKPFDKNIIWTSLVVAVVSIVGLLGQLWFCPNTICKMWTNCRISHWGFLVILRYFVLSQVPPTVFGTYHYNYYKNK